MNFFKNPIWANVVHYPCTNDFVQIITVFIFMNDIGTPLLGIWLEPCGRDSITKLTMWALTQMSFIDKIVENGWQYFSFPIHFQKDTVLTANPVVANATYEKHVKTRAQASS